MFEVEIKIEQGGNGEDVKIKMEMEPDYSSQSLNSAVDVKAGLVNGFAREDISLKNVRQNEAERPAPVDGEEREDFTQSAAVHVKVEYSDSDEENAAPDSKSENGGRGEDVPNSIRQQETVVGDMEDSFEEEPPITEPNLAEVNSSVMTMYKNLLDRGNSRKRGAKRHACDVCQRVFTKKSLLDIHSRTHTGEKPYKCDFCERRFVQNSNLQTHLKTHTGETPFQCTLCPCRFAVKCNLQRHLKSHTGEKPYECDVCHHRFIQKENLLTHLRTHTAEKPYQCSVCDARFRHCNVLTRHLRTHTGERPYQCDVCRQRFRQQSHLLRHTNIHKRKEKEKRAEITTPP